MVFEVASVWRSCCTSWEPVHVLIIQLLDKCDKTVRDELSKVCNVNFYDLSSTQLALPAEMGGLGVSSASLLALPAFLTSAFGASHFITTIFSETFEDVSFTKVAQSPESRLFMQPGNHHHRGWSA